MPELNVPKFDSLEEFINWWQTPSVRDLIRQDPQVLSEMMLHPGIAPWLDKFSESLHEGGSESVASRERALRVLAVSLPEDGAPVEDIRTRGQRQADVAKVEIVDVKETPPSFDKYRIKRKIAEGGFGAVYEAYDPQLDRTVALKLLKLRTEAEIEDFKQEAKLVAKLQHPNIIPVHELGVLERQPYFTMQFIEGKTLSDLLDEKEQLPAQEAFRIAAIMADVLAYAHSLGIIHRDMKPENVFIDPQGRVYVGDFGVAKQARRGNAKVASSRVVGTPYYMSPEQADGELLDARADIWSLGVMLYEMLCGVCPFEGEGDGEVFKKIWFTEPPSLRKLNPQIDMDAQTIVLKCLQKDADRRYESAAALKDDIERYLHGQRIKARRTGITTKLWRFVRRNKIASLAAVALLTAAIAVGFSFWRQARARAMLNDGATTANPEAALSKIKQALDVLGEDWYAQHQYALALERSGRTDDALRAFQEAVHLSRKLGDTDNKMKSLFRVMLIYWNKQELEDAYDIAQEVERLSHNRELPEAMISKAILFFRNGDYEEMSQAAGAALQLDENNTVALFFKARSLDELKKRDKAVETYTRCLRGFEKAQNTFWLAATYASRALVRVRSHDYDAAIADCEKAIELNPEDALAFACRGLAGKFKGDLDGALADCNIATELNPKCAIAYNGRGQVYFKKDKKDAAIADFNKSIQLNPNYTDAFNNRGLAKLKKGNYHGAAADFGEAIRLDPDVAVLYHNRGRARAYLGDIDEALADYNKAIELNPQYAKAYASRGSLRANRQDYRGAIEDYNQAIRLNPKSATLYYRRAWARSRTGALNSAFADYTKAIKLNPDYAMAYNNRGHMYEERGYFDKAIVDYKKALKIDPRLHTTWLNLASAYQKQQKFKEAVEAWTRVLELAPGTVVAYEQRAELRHKLGQYAGATADYEKLLKLQPERHRGWYNLACAYAKTGRKKEALQALKKAFQVDKTGELIQYARTDSDLDSLRDNPEFKRLVGE